jgi:OTU domain-containing protein 5
LCELYDRPAEIWGFDPLVGARKLRTFHEADGARPPMRLSYYGGGHYDSVVGRDHATHLLRSAPGAAEDRRIGAAAQRVTGALEETKRQSDVAATEGAELSAALARSRNDFDHMCDFEWIFSDQTAAAMAAADAEETSLSLLRSAEQGELEHALGLSGDRGPEDPELAHALSLSMGPSSDPELQHALSLSKAGKERLG